MADTVRILVASDVHAGYGENKKGYENDSFDGLEETLQHATEQDVDFILLGNFTFSFYLHSNTILTLFRR